MGAVLAGAVKLSWSAPSSGVIEVRVGAPGGPDGVTVPDGRETGPSPTEFTASTSKMYPVPLVSPVTVVDVEVEPVSSVVQDDPPLLEYCTM